MKYCVLGLAKSGVAAANALLEKGHTVVASDLRDKETLDTHLNRLKPGIEVVLGKNEVRPDHTVVVSPGIKPSAPVFARIREMQCPVIGEVGLFDKLKGDIPVLAITGTDGKSTTTTWLGEICAASNRPTWVGGNLGTPLCESLSEITQDHIVVAEVSCFQLWTSPDFHPDIAIFTNLAPDHLDYHGTFEAYVDAKAMLMANLTKGNVAVLNADDDILATWSAPNGADTWHYSRKKQLNRGVWLDGDMLVFQNENQKTPLVSTTDLMIPGDHNIENAMAAACGALAFGISLEAVKHGLSTYCGLEHRIERVRTLNGVTYYNDSKATNPHAAHAALKAFSEAPVLLCGGSEKGSDFSEWAELVAKHCRHVVCFGQTGPRMAELLKGHIAVSHVNDLEQALFTAREVVGNSGIIVLSPACASFDQFKSYEDRGQQFKAMVNAL